MNQKNLWTENCRSLSSEIKLLSVPVLRYNGTNNTKVKRILFQNILPSRLPGFGFTPIFGKSITYANTCYITCMSENTDLTKSDKSELIDLDGFNPEDVRKCSGAAKNLITQGEHFYHRGTGTKMILFDGMSGNSLVDIQVQGGETLRQLFVTTINMESADGMQLEINLQDTERTQNPHLPEKVQKLTKGSVPSRVMNLIRESPIHTAKVVFDTPTTNEDLKNLTQILENTKIDQELLQKVVDHEKIGEYVHEGEIKPKTLGSRIIGLLTKRN